MQIEAQFAADLWFPLTQWAHNLPKNFVSWVSFFHELETLAG